ncbi:hypothetical protein DYB30_000934 [Aphanomyces astaci]|uniref:Selenoprotein O n=1 Tax=Aphanomyces astaci TaxID=112090 RepID=A0A397EH97_APHAT|nr:hypothetical protein DYB30_000934 [Aphanomyces astaci]
MTTISEPLLNIHLSMEKTAAREGSGFHVELHPPENVRVARENVRGASFTKAVTTPLPQPKLVVASPTALRLIQDPAPNDNATLSDDAKKALTNLIAGTGPIEGLAHCYAGHQFGHFSGQLGDGAAILLGGTGNWEAQLKGAGLTAFSRTADGRKWNCHMLVNQWTLLFNDTVLADLHALVDATFDATYQSEFTTLVERKLGLPRHDPDTNAALVASFWATLTDTHADFTCVFRALSGVSAVDGASTDGVLQTLVEVSHSLAQAQVAAQPPVSPAQLAHLKNLLATQPHTLDTLTKQVADYEAFVASDLTPQGFKQTQENRWQLWLDQYQQHLAKYGTDADADVARRQAMNATNPKFILRNHVAQKAIDAASAGDLATVSHILHLLTHPFDDANECDAAIYSQPSDPNAPPLLVSCSS